MAGITPHATGAGFHINIVILTLLSVLKYNLKLLVILLYTFVDVPILKVKQIYKAFFTFNFMLSL